MKKFEPHMMYKGKKAIKANTHEKHLELKDDGYGHSSPFKMKPSPSALKCWKGYKRKPGTKEFSKGSCIKK